MFGTIYFAYDYKEKGRFYAVKTIDRKRADNDKKIAVNILREIALLGEIKSDHVVSIKASTRTVNNYYLVMELLNGGDRQNYVKQRGGRLQEHEARFLCKQIVLGLSDIKKANVIHRDLKLSNIMINFTDLRKDICNDPSFILDSYIRNFDFEQK